MVATTAYGRVGMATKVQRNSLVKMNAWTDLAVSDPSLCGTVSVAGTNGKPPVKADLTHPNRYRSATGGYRDSAGKQRDPRQNGK